MGSYYGCKYNKNKCTNEEKYTWNLLIDHYVWQTRNKKHSEKYKSKKKTLLRLWIHYIESYFSYLKSIIFEDNLTVLFSLFDYYDVIQNTFKCTYEITMSEVMHFFNYVEKTLLNSVTDYYCYVR